MSNASLRSRLQRHPALVAAALAVLLLVGGPGSGDDRNLFRAESPSPYVMMLLDVSDSMTWRTDDTGARASGDDPNSKLYSAKSALYEVINDLPSRGGIGFAHFRQSNHQYKQKRWLYRRADTVANSSLRWYSELPWPQAGMALDFGDELRISQNASSGSLAGTVIDAADEFVFPFRSPSSGPPTLLERRKLGACKAPDTQNVQELGSMSTNDYRLWRLAAYPKLGPLGTFHTWMYTERQVSGNPHYEVHVFPVLNGSTPSTPNAGNPPFIDVQMTVRRVTCSGSVIVYPNVGSGCPASVCGSGAGSPETPTTIRLWPQYLQDTENPPHTLAGVSDYISRHGESDPGTNYHDEHNFHLGNMEDYTALYTCTEGTVGRPWNGEDAYWEPNNNPSSDGPADYTTFPDPYNRGCTSGCLNRGDIVPWDWKPPFNAPGYQTDAATEIAWRMAPNLSVGETSPDFRIARYFKDAKDVSGNLPLKDAFNPALRTGTQPQRYPPLGAMSFTPLGGMLDNFNDWHDDWITVAEHPVNGDPSLDCKDQYAILLTDGAETCNTNGPTAARNLRLKGVRTFVIGFGAGVTASDLNEIADQGGTGSTDTDNDGLPDCLQFETCSGPANQIRTGDGVIIAANRDELVEALKGVFEAINLEPSTFATGAIPSGQSETEDTVALTHFQPMETASVWPGTINQFVRPLKLVTDGQGGLRPDTSVVCNSSVTTGCLAWNAAAKILDQAPNATEVLTDRMISNADLHRRVRYTFGSTATGVPRTDRLFNYPFTLIPPSTIIADERDFWTGLGIAFTAGNTASETAARNQAQLIVRETLRIKDEPDPRDSSGATHIQYVLGDSFHSDPRVIGAPADFFKLANDLEGNGATCEDTTTPNRGYRCFFERHRFRRQQLMLGSNDGQIHAFDAGRFKYQTPVGRKLDGEYDAGTGYELFAYVPRPMLTQLKALVDAPTSHRFGVDGPLVVDDFFVDPVHAGTPTPAERQWRSVAIGGFREGGAGYFALDVTQPDRLTTETVDNFLGAAKTVYLPQQQNSYVPTCMTNYTAQACGPLPYPSMRWEFTDACDGTTPCVEGRKDEDGNGAPDLGAAWSKVNTGRVLVTVNGVTEVRYVAIFGGGLDPSRTGSVGNFIYMLDVETGKVLYKRPMPGLLSPSIPGGAVPSEPAAVDTDQNGLLDTIYVGTVTGLLFKIDISTPAAVTLATGRVDNTSLWAPLCIFNTQGKPIYLPPTVTFIAETGGYALGFGTGDRENLWSTTQVDQGRFYMIVDTGFTAATLTTPLTEANFTSFTKTALPITGNQLLTPVPTLRPGWVLRLADYERVTSEAFAISGLLVFNSYTPSTGNASATCENGGVSNLYALLSTNGDALGLGERWRTTEGFASSPYASPASVSGGRAGGGPSNNPDPFATNEIQAIRQSLQSLFPPSCKFGGFSVRLASNVSNTAYFAIADVPVCIVEKNWKEF